MIQDCDKGPELNKLFGVIGRILLLKICFVLRNI